MFIEMKAKFLTIAMALLVGSFVTSCDKNDDNAAVPSAGISSDNNGMSGTEQAPEQSIGRMAEANISGKYTVLKYNERGVNNTKIFSGVVFAFTDRNIMLAHRNDFHHKGIYGIDMAGRRMKMHIEGNDLMMMISGSYRISEVTADGRIHLVSDDGMKSVVFGKSSVTNVVSEPVPALQFPKKK
jgi:hypothetical protein